MTGFALALLTSVAPPGELSLDRPCRRENPADDMVLTLGAWGRLTAIDGTVIDNFPFDADVEYGDLFDPGVGIRLEAGLLWTLDPGWEAGLLVTFGFDRFHGARAFDSAGDSLEPEDLEAVTILVGFRGIYFDPSGFWADARFLVGAVRWSDVDATFVLGGTPTSGVAFFDEVTRFALELGLRSGFQAGPLLLGLGVGFTVQGGPSRGSDVGHEVDPTAVLSGYLELGIEAGF
jgi:hypothetical protein